MIQALFRPLGRTLLVVTDSEAILAIAEETFGRFGAAEGEREPEVTLRLLADGPVDGSVTSPVFRTQGRLVFQNAGPGAILAGDREGGFAVGSFSPAALAVPAFFRSHFLHFGFLCMLASRGLMGVHGSALVKDGRGILLRGPSGSGKTTLAFAGARSRFQALAEDVVWLDLEADLWRGMPWHFHLLPDATRLFPELAGIPAALESAGKMKLEVDLEVVRPGSTAVEAHPGPVVLLERIAGQGSHLERLGLQEALGDWNRSAAGTETDFPGYRRHVEALLQRGAWRLRMGTDLDAALDLLDGLWVESLWE